MLTDRTCAFTGRRYLAQHDFKSPYILQIRQFLESAIIFLIEKEGVDRFISGGAIGADMLAYFTILKLQKAYPHIENILALPFKGHEKRFDLQNKKWFYIALKRANQVVYVDTLEGYKQGKPGIYDPGKYIWRDRWMVDQTKHLIALWDRERRGGTWATIKYANETQKNWILINVDRQ